jgi:CheY-like chemotaxis protein
MTKEELRNRLLGEQSRTIKVTSPEASDDLTTLVELKINSIEVPPRNCGWSMPFIVSHEDHNSEEQTRPRVYELSMERGGRSRAPAPSVRTLLVDHSPLMLKILAQILAAEGKFIVVGSATDGCQALRQIVELAPELVLMDFNLPDLDGAQATRCVKHFRNPPIVFVLSSVDSFSSREMCKTAGADAFVVKSEDLQAQLRAKLQEWFGSAANPRG